MFDMARISHTLVPWHVTEVSSKYGPSSPTKSISKNVVEVVVVVVVVLKEETSYRCEKISRKEEGQRAGRGFLYPANRAKSRANPD